MRALLAGLVVCGASAASAQPADPYAAPALAPAPAPAPAPASDAILGEHVAQALVQRAQELYDARVFLDAKQLAVEALARSANGPAGDQARVLIAAVNRELGISEPAATAAPDPMPAPGPDRPLPPIGGDAPPRAAGTARTWATIGSATVWGGAIGGLFADALETDATSASDVMIGTAVGAAVGALGGSLLARKDRYTTGDIAVVDTFAGIGLAGGLTIGMLMQPVESEAYSVNAIIGTASGIAVGLLAARRTDATPRRMLVVGGLALAGGGLPFLLYAGIRDPDADGDERVTGALASVGLAAGAWLGFRLTRGYAGEPAPGDRDDAPVALVSRHSSGRWAAGALSVQPLSPQLAPQRGLALPLLGAAF